eukprot:TRINITY_DN92276_c0_g1_i1.p1 TRINITY_DN92276_c0_g1~~TRINITY_DN92276_c0_g1_i1.p1  ORF type:complete len:900 (+),score=136.14 TRINITY_DN92276_c0_g1_i1:151-2850(+)
MYQMMTCEHLATMSLLVMDLAWVTRRPLLGLPTMVAGLWLQITLVRKSLPEKSVELATNVSMLIWLLGNLLWMAAEYIWDDDTPAGFLADISWVANLDRKWYAPCMFIALALQFLSVGTLLVYHVVRWVRWRLKRKRAGGQEEGHEDASLAAVQSRGSPDVPAYAFTQCLTLKVYYELFMLPWIASDTGWEYANMVDAEFKTDCSGLVLISAGVGFGAIAILGDSVRRQLSDNLYSYAVLTTVELCWVFGNLAWMLADSFDGIDYMKTLAAWLFLVGSCLTLLAIGIDWKEARSVRQSNENSDMLSLVSDASCSLLEAGAAGLAISEPMPRASPNTVQVEASPNAALVLPNKRVRKGARLPRLSKGVTVLPEGCPSQVQDVVQVAAGIALEEIHQELAANEAPQEQPANARSGSRMVTFASRESLSNSGSESESDGGSLVLRGGVGAERRRSTAPVILLQDLGLVSRNVQAWRTQFQHLRGGRVQPYHAMWRHGDKKITQLFRAAGGFVFDAASLAEVKLATSRGVMAKDMLYSGPQKLRSHLQYLKDAGVQRILLDSEHDLRLVAAELPAAEILVQLAVTQTPDVDGTRAPSLRGASKEDTRAPSLRGALKEDVAKLLALARQLGVSIAGVSVRSGQQLPHDSDRLDAALELAVYTIRGARQLGFACDTLDVGCSDCFARSQGNGRAFEENVAFADAAGVLRDLVAKHLSAADAEGPISLLLEPGPGILGQASATLTQVIEKTAETVETPGGSQRVICYTVNGGMYSCFNSCLLESSSVVPEKLQHGVARSFSASPTEAATSTSSPPSQRSEASDGSHLARGEDDSDRPQQLCRVRGPVRDNLDVIVPLGAMEDFDVGEWILWRGQGSTRRASQGHHVGHCQPDVRPWFYRQFCDPLP